MANGDFQQTLLATLRGARASERRRRNLPQDLAALALSASPFAAQETATAGAALPAVSEELPFGTELEAALESLRTLQLGTLPGEEAGLAGLERLADPTAQLAAARTELEELIAPELISRLTAAGFGRSGAVGEALAREGTRLTLPILQRAAQAGNIANQFRIAVAQARAGREAGQRETLLRGQLQRSGLGLDARQIAQRIALERARLQANEQSRLFSSLIAASPVTPTTARRTLTGGARGILPSIFPGGIPGPGTSVPPRSLQPRGGGVSGPAAGLSDAAIRATIRERARAAQRRLAQFPRGATTIPGGRGIPAPAPSPGVIQSRFPGFLPPPRFPI